MICPVAWVCRCECPVQITLWGSIPPRSQGLVRPSCHAHPPPHALTDAERDYVLDLLTSPAYADLANPPLTELGVVRLAAHERASGARSTRSPKP
jgi:hypothetical protein